MQNEARFDREWFAEILVIALGVACTFGGARYAALAAVPVAGCVGLLFVTGFHGWLAKAAVTCVISIAFIFWWVT